MTTANAYGAMAFRTARAGVTERAPRRERRRAALDLLAATLLGTLLLAGLALLPVTAQPAAPSAVGWEGLLHTVAAALAR